MQSRVARSFGPRLWPAIAGFENTAPISNPANRNLIAAISLSHRLSASTDVQTLVELFVTLLLLGVECRHFPLLDSLCSGTRNELTRAWLKLTDRRLGIRVCLIDERFSVYDHTANLNCGNHGHDSQKT
jgi:hypothetical protein